MINNLHIDLNVVLRFSTQFGGMDGWWSPTLPDTILSDDGRLLERPPHELGFDHIANLGCPGLAVPAKHSPYLLLHPTLPSLAQFTGPVEHRTMADEAPRFRGDGKKVTETVPGERRTMAGNRADGGTAEVELSLFCVARR